METLDVLSLPPGFGFHPKDEELVAFYLKRKIFGFKNDSKHKDLIPLVDIYKHEPWDLPGKCKIPSRDSTWHFFALKDRKYPNGLRSNRATEAGYWKSTGKDRDVRDNKKLKIGSKKTLVFHEGRPPTGKRSDWIMHEYYLNEKEFKSASGVKDIYVICRITKRNGFVSEDRKGQKVATNDGEKLTKTEIDFPDQPEVLSGTVVSKESPSTSDIDIDAWFEELLVPDFFIPSGNELEPQMEADITSVAREPEPWDSNLDQGAVGESAFLLQEDVQSILQSSSHINPADINSMLHGSGSYISKSDVHGMSDITNIDIASWPEFPTDLLEDDFSSYASNVQEETHEKSTTIVHPTAAKAFEDADALIQIRPSRQARPLTQVSTRLKLKTLEMKSRNSESVNHTVEFANAHRLALNEVDLITRPLGCSKSNPNNLCSTVTEVPSKSPPAATTIPKSDGTKRGMSLRRLRSAGLNCLVVGACIVGTAAPILYFMLRDALAVSC